MKKQNVFEVLDSFEQNFSFKSQTFDEAHWLIKWVFHLFFFGSVGAILYASITTAWLHNGDLNLPYFAIAISGIFAWYMSYWVLAFGNAQAIKRNERLKSTYKGPFTIDYDLFWKLTGNELCQKFKLKTKNNVGKLIDAITLESNKLVEPYLEKEKKLIERVVRLEATILAIAGWSIGAKTFDWMTVTFMFIIGGLVFIGTKVVIRDFVYRYKTKYDRLQTLKKQLQRMYDRWEKD